MNADLISAYREKIFNDKWECEKKKKKTHSQKKSLMYSDLGLWESDILSS